VPKIVTAPKKKLIVIFLSLAVFLLLINIVIDFIPKEKPVRISVNKSTIESRILQLLDEFSIEKDWIRKVPVKNYGKDSLSYIYNVNLPADIFITDLLKRMNTLFPEKEISFLAKEKKIRRLTSVYFYINDVLHLQINLKKYDELFRKFSLISFLVKDIELLNEEEIHRLLSLPFTFCLLTVPDEESTELCNQIIASNKQYAVYLKDFIDEEKFEINEGLSQLRLESSVISIITEFNEAKAFFINRKSGLFRSLIYNFVRDKFAERGKKLLSLDKYKSLSATSLKEVKSKFKFYEESLKGKTSQTFLIRAKELLGISNSVEKYLMRGNKIVPFEIKN